MPDNSTTTRYVRHPGDVLRVILGAALLAGCCLIAASESVSTFELGIFTAVNALPSWLYGLMWLLMQLGSLAAVFVVAALAVLGRRFRMAAELLAGGLAAYVAALGLKDLIGRGRPGQMLSDVIYHGDPAQGLGFPSGHAAVSAALAAVAVPFLARRWRRWIWAIPAVVGFARVFVGAHLPLDVVAGFLLGWTIGAAVHLAVGSPSTQVTADLVLAALRRAGLPVVQVRPADVDARGSTPFFASGEDGTRWFAKAVGVDQRDGDILFKAYRRLAFRNLDDERSFASAKRQIEAEALVDLLAARAGVRTPEVAAITTLDDGTTLLAHQALDATGLERAAPDDLTDDLLSGLWDLVSLLHAARIAHRDLRLANMMIDTAGRPWLLDFGFSQVAATDRLLSRDVAELLASQSTLVDPVRAVAAADTVLGHHDVRAALPYLTAAGLSGATRAAFKKVPGRLDELRTAAAAAVGVTPPEPVRFARINPRALAWAGGATAALYLLLGLLSAPRFGDLLGGARWGLLVPTVLAFAVAFLGAAAVLQGVADRPLAWGRALQLVLASAGSHRARAIAVGERFLTITTLRATGLDPGEADRAVLAGSAVASLVQIVVLLIVGSAAIVVPTAAGGILTSSVWVIVLLVLAVASQVLAWSGAGGLPGSPTASIRQGLRDATGGGARTGWLVAGSVVTTAGFTLTFIGATATVAPGTAASGAALVYLAAIPIAALAPVPAGVPVMDALLITGLLLNGADLAQSILAVLVFRLLTQWLVTPAAAVLRRRLNQDLLLTGNVAPA